MIVITGEAVYDGREQTVGFEVHDGTAALTEGEDYEVVSGATGVLPGGYTLVIRGIGVYSGEASAEWSILPSEEPYEVSITWIYGLRGEKSETTLVPAGETPVASAEATVDGYGLSWVPDIVPAAEPVTYTAVYSEAVTVTFKTDEQVFRHTGYAGDAYDLPESPVTPRGMVFAGWFAGDVRADGIFPGESVTYAAVFEVPGQHTTSVDMDFYVGSEGDGVGIRAVSNDGLPVPEGTVAVSCSFTLEYKGKIFVAMDSIEVPYPNEDASTIPKLHVSFDQPEFVDRSIYMVSAKLVSADGTVVVRSDPIVYSG